MKSEDIQRQIESIQNTLRKAKESAMLAPDNPALIELERIMRAKIEELEETARFERIFFADDPEELDEHSLLEYRPTHR